MPAGAANDLEQPRPCFFRARLSIAACGYGPSFTNSPFKRPMSAGLGVLVHGAVKPMASAIFTNWPLCPTFGPAAT
jgi:hypothetical protein